ncbi:hypothetical protein [Virgibacillus doumboii]|uniref:hypothetical protein n=1 Tax=Virgibacillus doumboii TaxID=2697503 RepID=UPI0019686853|nr:hypothetical protein [Virgibacillus doumboii]
MEQGGSGRLKWTYIPLFAANGVFFRYSRTFVPLVIQKPILFEVNYDNNGIHVREAINFGVFSVNNGK